MATAAGFTQRVTAKYLPNAWPFRQLHERRGGQLLLLGSNIAPVLPALIVSGQDGLTTPSATEALGVMTKTFFRRAAGAGVTICSHSEETRCSFGAAAASATPVCS
jgi:hypothetical protein